MSKPVIYIPSIPLLVSFASKPGGQRIESENIEKFWSLKEAQEIRDKKGIYIFFIQAPKGPLPWYVGQASKTFFQEIFTSDKIEKYNSALAEYKKEFKPFFQFLIYLRLKKVKLIYMR